MKKQAEFWAGRSCGDNVFCLKQVKGNRFVDYLETHLLFNDLQTAYDNIPVQKLWEVLQNSNINHTFIDAIHNGYQGHIKLGNPNSEPFRITKELQQESCISHTVFKMYVWPNC